MALAILGGFVIADHSSPALCSSSVRDELGRDGFGASVASAGDVDGDGSQDLLTVGSKRRGGDPDDARGRAFVFSGKDGHLLLTLDPPPDPVKTTFENSGGADGITSVAGCVEQGRKEASGVVVAETSDCDRGTGWILFISVKEGRAVRSIQRGMPLLSGGNARLIGDIDSDGVPDIGLFARFGWSSSNEGCLGLRVFSGKTAKELLTLMTAESPSVDHSMTALVDFGDVSGDGVKDIAAGFSSSSVGDMREAGRVDVYSGKDGKRLYRLCGTSLHGGFGTSLCAPGDLNGDGTPDLVVGALPNHGGLGPTPCACP